MRRVIFAAVLMALVISGPVPKKTRYEVAFVTRLGEDTLTAEWFRLAPDAGATDGGDGAIRHPQAHEPFRMVGG